MGRSVSRPLNSVAVAYRYIEYTDSYDFQDEYDSIREWLDARSRELWPSLRPCSNWLDNEDLAILENEHAYIGLSEYCGLVALWLVPKTDWYYTEHNGIAEHWCSQIADRFTQEFSELRSIGSASNGEQFFEVV